jgi:hypothetical protein
VHQHHSGFVLREELREDDPSTAGICELCQRVMHPNRCFDVESKSHCNRKPGELLSVDLYGPLPTSRAGAKFIFVCVDVFTKHTKL